MLFAISYDLENDRNRTKLASMLKDFGVRVQKSVFEADLDDAELAELRKKLSAVKLDKSDSIRLYKICGECAKKIKIFGKGKVTKDKDFYIA